MKKFRKITAVCLAACLMTFLASACKSASSGPKETTQQQVTAAEKKDDGPLKAGLYLPASGGESYSITLDSKHEMTIVTSEENFPSAQMQETKGRIFTLEFPESKQTFVFERLSSDSFRFNAKESKVTGSDVFWKQDHVFVLHQK